MKRRFYSLIAVLFAAFGLECAAQTISGQAGGHDYVDLGLKSGTKWATCNVGAAKPAEYGNYYAWGETLPKDKYTWESYVWSKNSYNTLTKYCAEKSYGKEDTLRILVKSDDAAIANWGSAWRMPTRAEEQELFEGCDWIAVDDFEGSGVAGRVGRSKFNGNTIFLPASGFYDGDKLYDVGESAGYWSSTLREYGSNCAYILYFQEHKINCSGDSRYYGQNIRAVVASEQ